MLILSHTTFLHLSPGPNFSVQNGNDPSHSFLQLIFWQRENDSKPSRDFAVEGFSRRKEDLSFHEPLGQRLFTFESISVGWKIRPEVAPKEETCVTALIVRYAGCSEECRGMAIAFGQKASRTLDERRYPLCVIEHRFSSGSRGPGCPVICAMEVVRNA